MSKTKDYIVSIDGGATYDERTNNFIFVPNVSVQDQVERFRSQGTGMQLSDGTFEFVPRKRKRNQSILLRKLPHGSLTEGPDGKVRLTLVFDALKEKNILIAADIALEATEAIKQLMRKRDE